MRKGSPVSEVRGRVIIGDNLKVIGDNCNRRSNINEVEYKYNMPDLIYVVLIQYPGVVMGNKYM